ncbi:MAG: YifB family Mg chelatase-like AAA ATPase [Oscillospiraceae bacterium]|nr:YifB family Mg chelatase-like AAA ATPase [Oscillospiraceae bacterium]
MTTSRVRSVGLGGVRGYGVTVECSVSRGLPRFDVVGLPDAAVKESRERVRSAADISGFKLPPAHIVVNLAPADTMKKGTLYDLPILFSILAASGSMPPIPDDAAFIGELSLSGETRPIAGALSVALSAERLGIKSLFVPVDNADEASFAEGVTVYPVARVADLIQHLSGQKQIEPVSTKNYGEYADVDYIGGDFAEVKGQDNVKRALEIAAAGGHNVLMSGPPGSGKSMLAGRMPSIFPAMSRAEALETTAIHSIAGETNSKRPIISARPFRSPHHTVSQAGLAGGGTNPKPGEISLAHNGVLFLDELPEFSRFALEALRQPMEEGEVTISRVSGSVTYPSRFILICAMNPCKCGWHGTSRCTCSDNEVLRYRSKISGPLLDRIDIYVGVRSLEFDELRDAKPAEPSASVRERVNAARELQRTRFSDPNANGASGANRRTECNGQMSASMVHKHCELDEAGTKLLRTAFDALGMTGRSHDKILRVARTIADLSNSEKIEVPHLAEALQYRGFEIGEDA